MDKELKDKIDDLFMVLGFIVFVGEEQEKIMQIEEFIDYTDEKINKLKEELNKKKEQNK